MEQTASGEKNIWPQSPRREDFKNTDTKARQIKSEKGFAFIPTYYKHATRTSQI